MKEMIMVFKKADKKAKVALILGLLCMVFSIANFFIGSDYLQRIIWGALMVVFLLDLVLCTHNNLNLYEKNLDLSLDKIRLITSIEFAITNIKLSNQDTYTKEEVMLMFEKLLPKEKEDARKDVKN